MNIIRVKTLDNELGFLQSTAGSVLTVGPRRAFAAVDAADQSLPAAATVFSSATMLSLQAGSWAPLSGNTAFLIEKAAVGITFRDASAQIQVLQLMLNNGLPQQSIAGAGMPYTAPAVISNLWANMPMDLLLPDTEASVLTNGPQLQAVLKNLDGALAHPYRRTIFVLGRVINNVEVAAGTVISD